MQDLANIFIKSIFIDNMVFAYFLGMCSYLAVSKTIKTSIGLGAAVIFVLGITVPLNYLLENYVLKEGALVWLSEEFISVDLCILSSGIYTSKYDILFVPPSKDGHQDHRKVSEIALALVRKYPCGVIEYRTPSVREDWIPNFFIDIHDVWHMKLNKLKLFESQQSKTYFGEDSMKSFHSNYQCSNKNKNIVESFKVVRAYN